MRGVIIARCTGLTTRVRVQGEVRDLKDKLTLTIDRDLIPAAKRHARSVGVSLSFLVEESLRKMIGDQRETFATRWRGSLKIVEQDEPRFQALKQKYLK